MRKRPQFEKDRILGRLGMRTKSSAASTIFSGLGLIGLGAVAGLCVGLLFAPSSGKVLRKDLGRRLKDGAGRATGRARELLEATEMAGA